MRKVMHTISNGVQSAKEFILKGFLKRQRVNSVTDLDQLYRQTRAQYKAVTQDDIKAVFKELQDKGAGTIVIGRGTKPTRFIWRYNLKQVAERAIAGMNNFKTLKPLVETSRARVVDPETRKIVREALTGPSAAKPKRRYTRQQSKVIEPIRAVQESVHQPVARAVIQLNLEVPSSWTQEDVQALVSLVTMRDTKSSTGT